jgi:hypothetical protein
MKVFISWSGPASQKVAEVLRGWLPSVLQAVDPYVSSEDTDKGARWSADLSRELESSSYGILCVTAGNVSAPWLNFEAGALSKSFDKSRVSPLLFGISISEVTGPLLQFQSTTYNHDDMFKLVKGINSASEAPLEPERLKTTFAVWWPMLKDSIDRIKDLSSREGPSKAPDRSMQDMVVEILELMRAQQRELSSIVSRSSIAAQGSAVQDTKVAQSLAVMNALIHSLNKSGNLNEVQANGLSAGITMLENALTPYMDRSQYTKTVTDLKQSMDATAQSNEAARQALADAKSKSPKKPSGTEPPRTTADA